MNDYKGFKIVDKIMLVCKEIPKESDDVEYERAYLVDPNSKSQLESARNWARYTEYGKYDYTKKEYEYLIEHEPVEYLFDNTGFKFKLKDCAGGSSQGGALSFWNCIVSKDDKQFLIGINSEMLLNVLLEGEFKSGELNSTVAFATKGGRCGVVVEGGDTHKLALKDMEYKNNVAKNKTTKYKLGDNITTISFDDWYLGEFYRYYEFIPSYNRDYYHTFATIDWKNSIVKKLEKPEKLHAFVYRGNYVRENVSKFSDCIESPSYSYISFEKTKPKRCIGEHPLEIDITPSEFGRLFSNKYSNSVHKVYGRYYGNTEPSIQELLYWNLCNSYFGIGVDSFELSNDMVETLTSVGVKLDIN